MAAEETVSTGGSGTLFAVLIIVALGAGGGAFTLHLDASAALKEVEDAKDRYEQMRIMKQTIVDFKNQGITIGGGSKETGDPLSFISEKARQAQLPPALLRISPDREIRSDAWIEKPFTVTLRPPKDNPIGNGPVVNFLRYVEDQRPSIKSKELNLSFKDNGFTSVRITLSSFERQKPKQAATPKKP